MPVIRLNTLIHAPIESCFDLSLNIDLHMQSMEDSNERAIEGKMAGQIGLGETVKWRAKHFGFYFTMTIKISEITPPFHFTDEMVEGPFKKLRHQHIFEKTPAGTMMTDHFEFQSPLGILGKIADSVVLEKYMRKLLTKRNEYIKSVAESVN